jgi:hypothetical protein
MSGNLITMPKDPQELRDEIERAQGEPAKEGHERTAEGKEMPTPKREDFLSNLEKVSRPGKS